MECKRLTDVQLDALSAEAARRERLRLNHNCHASLDDPIQRLCNAFEPGTYVRPHRHLQEDRWELFVALRGRALVLTFDESGVVIERITLGGEMDARVVEIAPGVVHAIASLEAGTILFEVKAGPYEVMTDKDFASWAPKEGDVASADLVRWYLEAKPGERFGTG